MKVFGLGDKGEHQNPRSFKNVVLRSVVSAYKSHSPQVFLKPLFRQTTTKKRHTLRQSLQL
jgi:hypothetical protein